MYIKILDPDLKITMHNPRMELQGNGTYKVDDAMAKKLIEDGYAVEVEAPAEKTEPST